MKYFVLLFFALLYSCSKENSDSELLEIDRIALTENLNSYKVSTYKFGKILIRASVEKDTISPEFQSFKPYLDRIFNKVVKYDINDPQSLSALDYVLIFRDYKRMEKFIMKTDEDIFPTLSDAFGVAYGNQEVQLKFYKGKEKENIQNIEHAILSSIVILSKDLGKEVSLYECSKTNPKLLPDSEIKTLLQFFRGFLFYEKGYYYLSEDEISTNIKWLDTNEDIPLPYTKAIFQWQNLSNEETHIAFHSLNHLFRGMDRLMMKREVDEERALQDFESFMKDTNQIGFNNEITWSIETYLYLKNEENEKAIASLTKLKSSKLLSSEDKKRIDESIEYLKNKKPDKVLNGVYDKYFLSKIATKYMFSILSKVKWEKLLKEQNVPHTKEMFQTIDRFNVFIENLNKYSSTENIDEAGKDIKEQGKNLWEKTRGLVK